MRYPIPASESAGKTATDSPSELVVAVKGPYSSAARCIFWPTVSPSSVAAPVRGAISTRTPSVKVNSQSCHWTTTVPVFDTGARSPATSRASLSVIPIRRLRKPLVESRSRADSGFEATARRAVSWAALAASIAMPPVASAMHFSWPDAAASSLNPMVWMVRSGS
ncbi:hypothetical protein [Rhodococcus erythropolis]|uniref:hypothetical protein n=1 Tax=Rhodococcus erythropolis TaxID=1833 RepID=UPI001F2C0205|nr:hypothetical protein [Rhodococcus erythropolis]